MAGWISWNGDILIQKTNKATAESVHETAERLLEKMKNEVPLDEGELMRSGTITSKPNLYPEVEVCISFGGGEGTGKPVVPYAKRWHENSANFQRGRKKRYVADPFNRYADNDLKRSLDKNLQEAWK